MLENSMLLKTEATGAVEKEIFDECQVSPS